MRFRSSKQKVLTLAVVGLVVNLSSPSQAFAHTKLISSTPVAGSTVQSWPTQVSLEFDEELQNLGAEKANFVVVNNAVGDQVSETDEVISGNSISVTLAPNNIKGPVLVFYHVVSSDGHPVEGEFKFTFGEGEITTEGVGSDEKEFPITIYLASAIFIVSGLFFAIYSYRRRN